MDVNHAPKKLLNAGSHRVCSVEETLARILPMRHEFGITRIANVTGLDRVGVPVAIAIRPNARSVAVSQGKGATYLHAKASALMEAIEIWHAERFNGPVYYASFADLSQQHAFINLARLPQTPGPEMARTTRMHWVAAHDLMSDAQKLVPLEMVHADYTHPLSQECGFYPTSTNGLASGNHPIEAICHAICEVIERDALAVWHHRPLEARRQTRLDPASFSDAAHIATAAKFAAAGLECALWDVSTDIGVATVVCVVHEPGVPDAHLGLGSGTHPDPSTALHRAMNEAAQTRLNYISGAREDLFHAEFSVQGREEKTAAFADLLTPDAPMRSVATLSGQINKSLEEDLAWLKSRLHQAGVEEIAVVDLSRADFGIPVVRVIIPGLEAPHDDAAYIMGPRAKRGMA
ncbi:hypothetical protein ROLI_036370 [Roseobacter fucihabitans]|uniref:YcaO domain-containing protein n=1 Tax=Roseobacter fucihabitans TaxID=1537242 RepID=A0ABZ2BWZ3_9RHOB|nr:YcaO-like family protein [Roseobacter litoralis]MBC6964501.1 YcaO-like family protein [Roseobacter litoralis]